MPNTYEQIKARKAADPEYAARLKSYSEKYRIKNLDKEKERNRTGATRKRSESRESYNAYMREWNALNKDSINAKKRNRLLTDKEYAEKIRAQDAARYAKNPAAHRNERLKSAYGIGLGEYMQMYAAQQGKCAICGDERPDHGKTGLVVDHCHTHGHVRKLLCPLCNKGLGQFRDDVQILAKALDYLNITSIKE